MAVLMMFLSGIIFALGLGISGMTQPKKVTGFLNIAGDWDPSLAFVMLGATMTYLISNFAVLNASRRCLGAHLFCLRALISTDPCWLAQPCSAWDGAWSDSAPARRWLLW